ncbi:MAG: NADH-quinone oxidoreductase subunit NuoI [Candidatus Tectomicrobia bacterium]|uniref:NADH-quinone oxidoreductase subunit I n=1 Tax=Tectimicrobiota bacterium TaxID=2528274 RepID=A0A932CLM5_UNCTE|nr:NADH-quinone oxidoreductase subunit NuoI [Candidatus Tectomicrobia bacterium]
MVKEILKGLALTFQQMLKKPITIQYPEEKKPMPARARGRHQLQRYVVGLERCVGCGLCSAVCPSGCITVVPGENTEEDRHSPGERYSQLYQIHEFRCIFCGFCQEACPVDAIILTEEYEFSAYSRGEFVYHKEKLLVPVQPGMIRQDG